MTPLRALEKSRSVVPGTTGPMGSLPLTVTAVAPIPRGRRSRLSRDLHDGVGQSLTALLLEMRVAIERGYATRDDLLVLEHEAEKALGSVRALAYRVRQRTHLADPLVQAQGYAERMAEIGGIFTIRSRPGEGTVVILEAPRFLRRGGAEATAQTSMSLLLDSDHRQLAAAVGG